MSRTLQKEISKPQTTISLGLTSAAEIFAGFIPNDAYREISLAIIPIIVFLLIIFGKNGLKEWETFRTVKYYERLIKARKADLAQETNPCSTNY